MSLADFVAELTDLERCYLVDITAGTCTCPDLRANRLVCKHIFFIFRMYEAEWEYSDLPASLTRTPRTLIDASDPVMAGAVNASALQLQQMFVTRLETSQQLTGQNQVDDMDMDLDEDMLLAVQLGSTAPRPPHPVTNKPRGVFKQPPLLPLPPPLSR
ncbi:MAG: hypothetical protein WDW38_005928 [Sanguina aurantia]